MRSKPFLIAFVVCVAVAMIGLGLDPPAPCWPRSWLGPLGLLALLGSLVTGGGLVIAFLRDIARPPALKGDRDSR